MKRDLTEGNVYSNLLFMAIPTMMGFMAQVLYDLVDMIWIGQFSGKAVAGITIFATVFWAVEVLNEIIGVSSISLISQAYGAKDMDRTRRAVEQTITFKFVVATLASLLLLLTVKPLMHFFSSDPEVIQASLDYGYIRLFFLPLMFASFSVNTALRCVGESKKPMQILVISSLINAILDPIFIFETIPFIGLPGLGLGVFGAAVATVISIVFAFLYGFYHLMNGKSAVKITLKGIFSLDYELDKKLLLIGLPSGAEVLFRNMANFFILRMVAVYGTMAIAAGGIGQRILSFLFMPLLGFSLGSSAIVGQNLGVDQVDRASQTAKAAAKMGFTSTVFLGFLIVLYPDWIMSIFVKDPAIIQTGATMLPILMLGLLFISVSFGLGSVFSGSGLNRPFFVSSVVARWCVQVPLLFIFVLWLKLPIHFVWLSYVASDIVESLIIFAYYRQGQWKGKRV